MMLSEQLAAEMRAHAPAGPQVEAHLNAAVTQMVANPGKLVRARLTQTVAAAHGLGDDAAVRIAVAVEYFHVSSLLLDDLPCMDDAQLRRGRPCAHVVHGEATAILAALAFINRAYALVGGVLADARPQDRSRGHGELDRRLGIAGLVGGQARDLAFASGVRSLREVGRIASGKTGAMLSLSLLLPALVSGANGIELRALNALSLYWGLAFQALDDLSDVFGTAGVTGKTTGRDRVLDRPSFVRVLGVIRTRRLVLRWLAQAESRIATLAGTRRSWACLEVFQRDFQLAAASMTRSDNRAAA